MKKVFIFILLLSTGLKAQLVYDCNLWGLSSQDGKLNKGTLFSYNLNSDTLINRANFSFDSTGMTPYGSLFMASNGNLFGTAWAGGTSIWNQVGSTCNGCGTFFEYDTSSNTLIKRFDFDYDSGPGALPYGNVIQATDGYLYGMTNTSLVGSGGALFQYDIVNHTMTDKGHFSSSFGYGPQGSLIQASDGKLYGMTNGGGSNNEGSLFSYDIVSGLMTKLLDFNSTTTGARPYGSLIQASDGLLYGLTYAGGAHSSGVLFSYNILTNVYSTKVDFHYTTSGIGSTPFGDLMQASNGKLYGLTYKAGLHNYGTLFEYDIATNTATKKYDFNGSNGKYSKGTLMQARNGKLYGVTQLGGSYSGGVLFEYDIALDTFIKKADFSPATGYKPAYTKLLEICTPPKWDPLNVTIPNVFTPNGDGINDNWFIAINYKELIKEISVSIYNRWGLQVYTSNNKTISWSGHAGNGELCIDGTYFYTVQYTDSKSQHFSSKGFLTLTR